MHVASSNQVTIFQLEKLFGKGKEAQEFITELCKGALAPIISLLYSHEKPQKQRCQVHSYYTLVSLTIPRLRTEGCSAPSGLVCLRFCWLISLGVFGLQPLQAPGVKKAMMYKVLKEVVEDKTKGETTDSTVS